MKRVKTDYNKNKRLSSALRLGSVSDQGLESNFIRE